MDIFRSVGEDIYAIVYAKIHEEYIGEYSETFFINNIPVINSDPNLKGVFCHDLHNCNKFVFISQFNFADNFVPRDMDKCKSNFGLKQYIENTMYNDIFNINWDTKVYMMYFADMTLAEEMLDVIKADISFYTKYVDDYLANKSLFDDPDKTADEKLIFEGSKDIIKDKLNELDKALDYVIKYSGKEHIESYNKLITDHVSHKFETLSMKSVK